MTKLLLVGIKRHRSLGQDVRCDSADYVDYFDRCRRFDRRFIIVHDRYAQFVNSLRLSVSQLCDFGDFSVKNDTISLSARVVTSPTDWEPSHSSSPDQWRT